MDSSPMQRWLMYEKDYYGKFGIECVPDEKNECIHFVDSGDRYIETWSGELYIGLTKAFQTLASNNICLEEEIQEGFTFTVTRPESTRSEKDYLFEFMTKNFSYLVVIYEANNGNLQAVSLQVSIKDRNGKEYTNRFEECTKETLIFIKTLINEIKKVYLNQKKHRFKNLFNPPEIMENSMFEHQYKEIMGQYMEGK